MTGEFRVTTHPGQTRRRPAPRALAVTFDDLPLQQPPDYDDPLPPPEALREINGKLLEGIAAYGVPAVGFVNEKGLHDYADASARRGVLEMWLDAGLELGNHTFSHVTPEETSLRAYCEDVVRGEGLVKELLAARGRRLRFFRHPKLHTGPSLQYKRALERFLGGRGYVTAPVTIKHQDWVFGLVYAGAKARGDGRTMRLVAEAYVAYIEEAFEFFEKLSDEVLGYELSQVLLLHVNELNADHFDGLFGMIRARGYEFIPLGQALEDEAYRLPDEYVGTKGPSWLHRWAFAKGMTPAEEPREPASIRRLFEATARERPDAAWRIV